MLYKKHVEMNLKDKFNRYLYTVKIIDTEKPIHIGSTSLFNQYCLQGLYEKAAYHYFNGENAQLKLEDCSFELFPQEVIVESDIEIIGCV